MKLGQRLRLTYIRTKFKLLSAISKKIAAQRAFDLFCTPPTRDRKDLPDIFKKADTLKFKFQGYDVVGYRWNENGKRRVLIVHGFESSALNFAAYVEPLIQKGFEVFAFDAPAHGYSSGTKITAVVYRDLIKHIDQHYGPIRSFMGHSLGGFVLSLVLSEIPHDESFRAAFIAPSAETSSAINNFFQFLQLGDGVRKEFEKHIETLSGQPVAWFSIDRAMNGIKAKILWVHDEGDVVTPFKDAMAVRSKNYHNMEFVITKGLGHSRIYRDAEVIRTVVDFL